jgi:murein DD-endopeptidase MepM/ murein hydrolase activator NlpD
MEQRRYRRLQREATRELRKRRRKTTVQRARGKESAWRPRRLVPRAVAALALIIAFQFIVPPYRIPVNGTVTSVFFVRQNPQRRFLPSFEMHRGLDIAAQQGTPVRSARSGLVVESGFSPSYGNHVVVRHWFGMRTVYAHLAGPGLRKGAVAWRGRRLGTVGTTGRATGPHLHFEVKLGRFSLPPGYFLLFHTIRRRVVGW